MKKLLVATALSLVLLSAARAENMLADKIDGKLTLSGNVGYIYNFAGKWKSHNSKSGNSVGYGLSFGYDHKSGFGISSEYLTYTHNYQIGDDSYKVPYHIATFTPSYRVNFGDDDNWYFKTGLGLGFSISSIEKTSFNGDSEIASGLLYNKMPTNDGLCHIANDLTDGGLNIDTGILGVSVYKLSYIDSNGNEAALVSPDSHESIYATIRFTSSSGELPEGIPGGVVCITLWDDDIFTIQHKNGRHYVYGGYTILGIGGTSHLYNEANNPTNGIYVLDDELHNENDILRYGQNGTTVAVDDAGFVIAPTLAFGYDDDIFHFDITTKYIHALKDVVYNGQDEAPDQTQNKGALAFYIGAGIGFNF